MPLTEGVFSTTAELPMRRKPKPRTHARCDSMVPIRLLTSVTFTVSELKVPDFVFLAISYPRISSTLLPRLAAISAGEFKARKPFNVARTML